MPELRSMTGPLMERFGVVVEPLDSLFGIDAARLPEPVDEFRERGAALRLAWAAAADWPSPINLLRFRKRQASKRLLARVAVATGMAAGLVLGWRIERSQTWRSMGTTPAANLPVRAQTASMLAPPAAMKLAPPAAMNPAAHEDRSPPTTQRLTAVSPPAPTPVAAITPLEAPQPAPPRARLPLLPGSALPFDAVLGTILYSPGRRLAIVDGGIVAPGDEVRGARILEITPDAVLLRDGQGRLKRLGLGVGVR